MVPTDIKNNTVKSDETLFSIIEYLYEMDGAKVTRIAEEIGMSKSSVHKHLKSLEKCGYVIKKDGLYYPSFKFLTIGGRVRDTNVVCNTVQPEIYKLADETDEMVLFSILEHGEGTFVFRINERYGIRKVLNIGERFKLHQNSSGKAMLSKLPDRKIARILDEEGLEASTDNTVTDRAKLFDQIKQIRTRGFALNLQERREGINAIGVALHDEESDLYGAISMAGATYRLPEEELRNEYAELLLQAASEIELKIRYS